VLVVTSPDDPTANVVRAWSARDPRVGVVLGEAPMTAGAARNLGRQAAGALTSRGIPQQKGDAAGPLASSGAAADTTALLLFIDADCMLAPGGATRLASELDERGASAISARVVGEGGAVARVRHILEFKEAASRREPPAEWLPPSTTLLCRAEAFDRAGGFPDLWPGEDLVFCKRLRDLGDVVVRSTRVESLHRHPPGVAEMLRHQHRLGRTAALARRMASMHGERFTRSRALALLLLPGRSLRIARWQLGEGAGPAIDALSLSPLLLAGLTGWTAGFVSASGARARDAEARDLANRPRARDAATGASANRPRAGDAEAGASATRPRAAIEESEATAPRGGTRVSGARVVAVVPVFMGEAVLSRCLDALLATGDHLSIVVADDGSTDASLSIARRHAAPSNGRILVLALGRNHGFAGAINRGVEAAMAAFGPAVLVLVNQDCFVKAGWLAPLVEALADPLVAAAGARLLEADGATLQHAGARIEPNGLTAHIGRGARDDRAHRDACDVDYVCGALFALRTETWKRFGPFDEAYAPAYFEEVDFCVRARREGLRTVYVPTSEAVHAEASTSPSPRAFYGRYHRSRLRFVVLHLVREHGAAAWLRSELLWLARLRDRDQLGPLLRAYARVPGLLLEQRRARA
jgi:GT2 family glycosyltransferase